MSCTDDSIFEGCELVVEGDVVNQRVACLPMEGRSTAAAFVNGKLTVWTSTQNAQISRLILTAVGLPPEAIRVVAPDVGGGFGAKIGVDRESIIIAWAAKHIGRPVRWVETRSENMLAMTQGRAQRHHIKIGGGRDGRIKAYRLDVIQDTGAYPRMSGFLPMLTNLMAPGVYDIPAVQAGYKVVVTERDADRRLPGRGPSRGRRHDRAGGGLVRGRGRGRPGGDAQAQLHPAGAVPVRHQDRRPLRHRRLRGAPWTRCSPPPGTRSSGPSSSAAATPGTPGSSASAWPPTWRSPRPTPGPGETAKVEVHDDGTATVYTGSSAHGQGHHTAFAMIVTAELGIPMDKVEVIHGDTDLIPDGIGTYASRSLQLGGSAVQKAAIEVKDEAAKRAADLFEAAASRR